MQERPPPEKTKLPVGSLEAAMTIRGSNRGRFDKKRSNMISRLKKPESSLHEKRSRAVVGRGKSERGERTRAIRGTEECSFAELWRTERKREDDKGYEEEERVRGRAGRID